MSLEEAAWIGAMLEGEGTVSLRFDERGYEDVDLVIYNSEVETIATCLRVIGDGCVYYRGKRLSSKWPGSGSKEQWAWSLQRKPAVRDLLRQIIPYLTGKQDRAKIAFMVLHPIAGASCHPTHFEGPRLPGKSDQEVEEAWKEFKKMDEIDPRAIKRQHRFTIGQHPQDEDADPNSGVTYFKIEGTKAGPTEPDQRGELAGGPTSGMPCQRCGEMTVVAGRKSLKDIYDQPEVDLVNRDQMTKEDWKRIEETVILVLACPNCKAKYQWREEFLPKKLHPIE